ncbi:hypothetical protein [Clostridium tertium]|uniref:Helix-turn-helix domain-containing protein n=1 Tax=Clostridium tertium TaxID=1559 RepID=A0A6N3ESQ2_9CLOT
MNITIITSENRRLYPAMVYVIEDKELKKPIFDIDDIYNLLYNNQNILVMAIQFDQYGKELKVFNGELGKSDIKALFASKNVETGNELESVMTLSEAAKKWGLSDGSTIRKAIERGKFEQNEIKQAGNVWITTYSAMERVFGSIKNEENTFVIYDDFECIYMTKEYWEYAKSKSFCGPNINVKARQYEIKYGYIKDAVIEGLKALKNNQKVIIKKSRSKEIRQIIDKEDEFYLYIELFNSRKILPKEFVDRLLDELKIFRYMGNSK